MFERTLANECNTIIALSSLDEVTEFISASSITDIYYIVRKNIGHSETVSKIRNILTLTHIATVDEKIVSNALMSEWSAFEDSVQYYTAISEKCDYIIIINKKDYENSAIPVYTPNEFLELQPISEMLIKL